MATVVWLLLLYILLADISEESIVRTQQWFNIMHVNLN